MASQPQVATTPQKIPGKTLVGVVAGIIIGLLVAFITPPEGLNIKAMWVLGIFAWAIVYWIFEVFPDWITAILMAAGYVLIKAVPFNVSFSSFASDTVWLMIGAMGIGAAAAKTGLLKRSALKIMCLFPATFRGQTLAMLASGAIIAPIIPSTAAKAAIVSPFARAVSDTLAYPRNSKGALGIFSAMVIGFICTGPLYLSSSWLCYLGRGLLPAANQAQFDWVNWLMASAPWGVVLLIGSYFAIMRLYRPADEQSMPSDFIRRQLEALGPMSRNEKITMAVMVIALLLWMTERVHGVSSMLVALFGFCILGCFKVLDRNDVKTGIPWDSILFIGGILSVASVFPALKIDKWIGQMLGPSIAPLLSNIYVFVIVASIFFFVLRFVLVSQVATITIFTLLLTPFLIQAGINPWVIMFMTLVCVNTWNVKYQNSTYLIALYGSGEMVNHPQTIPASVAYMVLSILGMLACVPIWQLLGLVP